MLLKSTCPRCETDVVFDLTLSNSSFNIQPINSLKVGKHNIWDAGCEHFDELKEKLQFLLKRYDHKQIKREKMIQIVCDELGFIKKQAKVLVDYLIQEGYLYQPKQNYVGVV